MAQIGLMLEGQFGLTWARWQRLLQAAESLGYQCMFRSDHFSINTPYQESLETWVSLTYAASHTQRIEFGPLVSPITFRHPAMLARMATSVDDLSQGRLVLGLGIGWNEQEHKQFGVPFYDRPTRQGMFADGLEVTTRLLREDKPVNYQGKYFSLEDAILLPRPQRRTPILIGGNGPQRTLPLAAHYADEWNGVFISPTQYRTLNSQLTELIKKEGRDPASVKRSLMTEVVFDLTESSRKAIAVARPDLTTPLPERARLFGSPAEIIDHLSLYVEAGVQRFMLQWLNLDDLDGLEKMAAAILPHFRS